MSLSIVLLPLLGIVGAAISLLVSQSAAASFVLLRYRADLHLFPGWKR
jgi:O-antigen/teichoic acid export membrane protein